MDFAPLPAVEAVQERVAQGSAFLLPTDDGIETCEELARRFGLPFWQFAGPASAANAEALRLARLASGRETVLLFEGKYHGHIDENLGSDGGFLGPLRDAGRQIALNDLEALKACHIPYDCTVSF